MSYKSLSVITQCKKEQPKNMLRITHITLNLTCKWINQSKGMNTKQYTSKKESETKHNTLQNMFKVQISKENDKTLINNLKHSNFKFNVK